MPIYPDSRSEPKKVRKILRGRSTVRDNLGHNTVMKLLPCYPILIVYWHEDIFILIDRLLLPVTSPSAPIVSVAAGLARRTRIAQIEREEMRTQKVRRLGRSQ